MERTACPFCNPHQRILKENTLAYVLLSSPRKVPGHFLVIPNRHVEKPWELTPEETTSIFELITFVQQRVVAKLSQGCDVRQHYRPFLKQSRTKVDHVHYHVIPRSPEDVIYAKVENLETNLFEDLSTEEHDRIAKILD
jgi:diadenosine tetraphosphate (Ap4A) HIT family hydrolase